VTFVAGRTFGGAYRDLGDGEPAEMSLEVRFAERLKVGVGDRLSFEVQGVPIEGRVVNLRRVRWTSFEPNFFVTFQPGVLEDAPRTVVAAVPELPPEAKSALQTQVVRAFPNVSIIDVAATVDRLLAIVGQMSLAVYVMALLALGAGLAVLVAIAHHQAERRIPDVTLLKILGTGFGRLVAMALVEFGLLAGAASLLGAVLSVVAAYVLSWTVFDRLWTLDARLPAALAVGATLVSTLLAAAAVGASLRTPPRQLLGAARFR
jgi:putative ABC transport system permease protein